MKHSLNSFSRRLWLGFLSFGLVVSAHALDLRTLIKVGLVAPEILLQHREDLDLTAAQANHLRTLGDSVKQEASSLEAAVREEQQSLETLLQDATTPPENAASQLKQLLDAEASLKQLQLRVLLDIRRELTPAQTSKALVLATQKPQENNSLEQEVQAKATKLKSAFQALGIEPARSLKERGAQIENLIRSGKLKAANQALDSLGAETGINEPASQTPIDYNQYPTGNTELSALQERYQNVQDAAKQVIRLGTLKQLIQARDDLEKAKSSEDAERVGKILSWAETVLAPSR